MYGGYAYTKKIEKKNRQRSECCQRKTENCKAAVTTVDICQLTERMGERPTFRF